MGSLENSPNDRASRARLTSGCAITYWRKALSYYSVRSTTHWHLPSFLLDSMLRHALCAGLCPEFKQKPFVSSDKPASQVAREIGVSDNAFRIWVKQSEIDQGEREGLTTEEREKLRHLRRENKVLGQEKEIS